MAVRKRGGSGRATPKGTKNPEKKSKVTVVKGASPALPTHAEGKAAKAGQGSGRISRPLSHNRGNR
jgi:hypothetical protein